MWARFYDTKTLGHSVNTVDCSAHLLFDPENNVDIVVMTNQGNEAIYNYEMMNLIFGEFEGSQYEDLLQRPRFGLYQSARTIKEGPFKLYDILSYRPGPMGDLNNFWYRSQTDNGYIANQILWDIIPIGTGETIVIFVLILLFMIGIIYSIVTIISYLVRLFRENKYPVNIRLKLFNFIIALLIIVAFINFISILLKLLEYRQASDFVINYLAYFLMAIALVVLSIKLLVESVRDSYQAKGKWKNLCFSFGI